jgi:hypothetical protein
MPLRLKDAAIWPEVARVAAVQRRKTTSVEFLYLPSFSEFVEFVN